MRFTPENIQNLKKNQVIVVGTNNFGIHGAGAAKLANQKFGLTWGKTGYINSSYGLNTKDKNIQTLPLSTIKDNIEALLDVVKDYPKKEWLLTKIGCGLAGYSIPEIANLFIDFFPLPQNLIVPKDFYDFWIKDYPPIFKKYCEHKNERVEKSGITGTLGTVICNDCGNQRDYNAY